MRAAAGLQGLACGGRALAVPVGRVDDDLVVAAQLPQGAAGAREPQRARDMPGPEGPPANRHDELDVLSGVQLGLELLPGDRPHRWDLSLGASATDDPLTPRAVSAARHLRAVPRSTRTELWRCRLTAGLAGDGVVPERQEQAVVTLVPVQPGDDLVAQLGRVEARLGHAGPGPDRRLRRG